MERPKKGIIEVSKRHHIMGDEHHFSWGKLAIIIITALSAVLGVVIIMGNLNRIFG
jgi:hypothetical protein